MRARPGLLSCLRSLVRGHASLVEKSIEPEGRGLCAGRDSLRVVLESLRRAAKSRIPSNGKPFFALSVNRWPFLAF